jgi:hypothetical protein
MPASSSRDARHTDDAIRATVSRSTSGAQPLRGDAAFRASIAEIAKRNRTAQAEAARRREAKDADATREAARRPLRRRSARSACRT